MDKIIYCISGLGVDEKVFNNLKLNGYALRHIPWLKPVKNESFPDYALRMASIIEDEQPILLGVSFGGMLSIEIAKQRPVQKVFIISSLQTDKHLPRWMKLAGKIKLNKVLPAKPHYLLTEKLGNWRLGVSNEEEKKMVRNYRKKADKEYLTWAIHHVLNWKNEWRPENLVHIHGDQDKIFPIKNISPTHVIKDGTHMIVYNRAKEVADCIEKELAYA